MKQAKKTSKARRSPQGFRRGIFFSVDSVFALVVAAIILAAAFLILFAMRADSEPKLQAFKASQGWLSALEKTGVLQRMSAAEISNASFALPSNLCPERLEVKKYPLGESVFAIESVQGCSCPGESFSSAASFVLINSSDSTQSNFIATLKSCGKAR